MDEKLSKLIDESIKVELNVAKIYMFFCDTFSEDSDFWWKLGLEEKNHAGLIKIGRGTSIVKPEFPVEILAPSVEMLFEANKKLISMLKEYRKKLPSREKAFNIALDIEQSASELHFQLAMEKPHTSAIMEIFHKLNKEDKDHTDRIRTYMSDKGIETHS
jgi:hypothetical protein